MSARFVIIGAGGYSAEVADLLVTLGHEVVAYFDELTEAKVGYLGAPVVRSLDGIDADSAAFAIGDGSVRARMYPDVSERFAVPFLAHPTAVISPGCSIGDGTLALQHVVVNARATVGTCSILNVAACITHDCSVGSWVHLAPGVQMGGGSSVGDYTLCGTSSTVLPYQSVGARAVIGAGSVVTESIPDDVTAVGAPARVVSRRDGKEVAR